VARAQSERMAGLAANDEAKSQGMNNKSPRSAMLGMHHAQSFRVRKQKGLTEKLEDNEESVMAQIIVDDTSKPSMSKESRRLSIKSKMSLLSKASILSKNVNPIHHENFKIQMEIEELRDKIENDYDLDLQNLIKTLTPFMNVDMQINEQKLIQALAKSAGRSHSGPMNQQKKN